MVNWPITPSPKLQLIFDCKTVAIYDHGYHNLLWLFLAVYRWTQSENSIGYLIDYIRTKHRINWFDAAMNLDHKNWYADHANKLKSHVDPWLSSKDHWMVIGGSIVILSNGTFDSPQCQSTQWYQGEYLPHR